MFSKRRYCTRGIDNDVDLMLQITLWWLITELGKQMKLDYLQIFDLSYQDGKQKIVHKQERPEYKKEYLLEVENTSEILTEKIYVIDDSEYSTMLFASEY